MCNLDKFLVYNDNCFIMITIVYYDNIINDLNEKAFKNM